MKRNGLENKTKFYLESLAFSGKEHNVIKSLKDNSLQIIIVVVLSQYLKG